MYRIGIDLGGTNIKAGLFNERGEIIERAMTPTGAWRHYTQILKDMADIALTCVKNAGVGLDEVLSVGVGSPGSVDNKNGVLIYSNNINFKNVPMRAELSRHMQKPIFMGNDADCAALGEYRLLGEDIEHMIFITLGTGVGGGIIINRKLYNGFNGAGGELGHMVLISGGEECSCGRRGCWEAYASVPALIRITMESAKNNPDGVIMQKVGGDISKIGGKDAFDAAREGDAEGLEIVNKWLFYVSEGLTSIINIFQPEVLVIGGAISKEGAFLLDPVSELISKNRYTRDISQTRLQLAKLGNDAGLVGAAFLE